MSPSLPDHYAILGVAKDAQIPEIRSAHRKLVLKCHPDKVQDPTLKAVKQDEFQKVQTAYEVLSNEKERRRYDDSLRLAELKAQLQNKANSSAPRTTKYDVKVSESSRSSYKQPASGSPNVRVFTTYSPSSWDDDKRSRSQSRPRYYEQESRHSKREPTYSEKPSKRESEREREREREKEKEKERDRERRRKEKKEREREEEQRRQEKAAKKEKKEREKQKSKDIKKGSEEKRQDRYAPDEIYVEFNPEDYPPKSEKKKSSSSKKHEEKRERDRSLHRDEPSPRFAEGSRASFAQEYIRMARSTDPVYYSDKPAAPSPPPPRTGPHSPPQDDEVRRSSADPRRVSPEGYREKSRRKASREHLDDEDEPVISSSPPKYSSSSRPEMGTSPPGLSRTNSVPIASTSRPIPTSRSKTFNYGEGGESPGSNRGRHKSRHHPQVVDEEFESDDEHDHRPRERKHRSSKKHRSPEGPTEFRYHVDGGRSKLHSTSYSFNNRGEYEPTSTYGTSPYDYYDRSQRPAMYSRDSGYGGGGSHYDRVKTSKAYGVDDAAFSSYNTAAYGGEYGSVPA